MTSLQSRILVAAVGVPVLLWAMLWAPPAVLTAMLAALSGIAAWELLSCTGERPGDLFRALTVLAAALVPPAVHGREGWLPALLVAYCLAAFAIAVVRAGALTFSQLMAGVFAVMVIPWAFSAFLKIYGAGHRGYLLLPLIFSFASDTFAFFAGHAFGKRKLAPRVSPHKTVEGAVGGLAGSVVCGLLFALAMNTWFGQKLSLGWMAAAGLGCGVVAQLGDLSFSLIKREFGIKDYGRIFLAHGGVLDRFDSVLFVAPVTALLLPRLV